MSYLEHIAAKEPHERRTHALQLSLGIVALVALGWLVMLPLRFASLTAQDPNAGQAQTASVVQNGNATLLVSTTTQYGSY